MICTIIGAVLICSNPCAEATSLAMSHERMMMAEAAIPAHSGSREEAERNARFDAALIEQSRLNRRMFTICK
jgi:hypothetical protein